MISHDWAAWLAWFGAASIPAPERPPAYRLGGLCAALEAAEQGLGLALGSRWAEPTRIADGRLAGPFDISAATGRRGLLVWPSCEKKTLAVRRVVRWFAEEFASGAVSTEVTSADSNRFTAVA